MKKILTAILIMASTLVYGATRTETDNMMFKGLLTVSNNVVIGSNLTVAGSTTLSGPLTSTNLTTAITKYDTVYTLTTNLTMTATTSTNYSIPLQINGADLANGKFYVRTTNTMPFANTITMTTYSESTFRDASRLAQYDFALACVSNTTLYAVGATNIVVPDNSNFAVNDMIWLPGSTNEFAVIKALSSTTNIVLNQALTNFHAVGYGVMKVKEYGGEQIWDNDGADNDYYINLSCTNAITVDLQLVIRYAK